MFLVSHYLLDKAPVDFPQKDVTARVNVAWVASTSELHNVLGNLVHDIYLDYPQGRTKPPKPRILLEEAVATAHKFSNVKYFAVSNVEDPDEIYKIKMKLPTHVEVVPKIETRAGVANLKNIIRKLNAKYVMLDKEDLYTDVNRDSALFEKAVSEARQITKDEGIDILELHGVVFMPRKL